MGQFLDSTHFIFINQYIFTDTHHAIGGFKHFYCIAELHMKLNHDRAKLHLNFGHREKLDPNLSKFLNNFLC